MLLWVPQGSGVALTGLVLHPGLHPPRGAPLLTLGLDAHRRCPHTNRGLTQMHRTHLMPADLLCPGGPDSRLCLSSHPVLRPYRRLWKPSLPAHSTSEALTRVSLDCSASPVSRRLPLPLSRPSWARPRPAPPASTPRTEGVCRGLSRAPGMEQACTTNIHKTH